MDKKEASKIDRFEVSRVGLRSFFGNPEKFEITPFAITIYFFIEFQDSLNSMESVYEFIWGATAFGVGIISFLFTKLMERVTRL